jgi:hypothetical protein
MALHSMGVRALTFTGSFPRLLSVSGERTIVVTEVDAGRAVRHAAFLTQLRSVAVTGMRIIVGDAKGGVYACLWCE